MAALPSRKQNREREKREAVKNRVKFLTERSIKTCEGCPCSQTHRIAQFLEWKFRYGQAEL